MVILRILLWIIIAGLVFFDVQYLVLTIRRNRSGHGPSGCPYPGCLAFMLLFFVLRDEVAAMAFGAWVVLSALSRILPMLHAKWFNGRGPLHRAVLLPGGAWRVRQLLRRGAEVEARDIEGLTPLHVAAEYGRLAAARELIRAGADLEARDNVGHTPLHLAARTGRIAVVRELIRAGADLEAKTNQGLTPLHVTPKYGHIPIAQELIRAGAVERAPRQPSFRPTSLPGGSPPKAEG